MTSLISKPEHEIPTEMMVAIMERGEARAAEMIARLDAGEPITAVGPYGSESGIAEVAVWRRLSDRDAEIRKAVRGIVVLEHYGLEALPPGSTPEDVRKSVEIDLTELAVFVSDELAERLIRDLPSDLIDRGEVDAVASRRPVVLETADLPYRCDVSGEDHAGPAVVFRARPQSSLHDDIGGDEYHVSPAALMAAVAEAIDAREHRNPTVDEIDAEAKLLRGIVNAWTNWAHHAVVRAEAERAALPVLGNATEAVGIAEGIIEAMGFIANPNPLDIIRAETVDARLGAD